jgi:hypothetical protein
MVRILRGKGRVSLTCLLPDHLSRILVFPHPEKHRLARPIVPGSFREFDLTDHGRLNPNTTIHFGDD